MPCTRPLRGTRRSDGKLLVQRYAGYVPSEVVVSCGQCGDCRVERSRQWATRLMHEAEMHTHKCFVTLTYDEKHLPPHGTLVKKHAQDFFKRARKRLGRLRYFHCGEYGEGNDRPHYHIALYGTSFLSDRTFYKSTDGNKLYTSKLLDELWLNQGMAIIGDLTFESAQYVARYITKSITGKGAELEYTRLADESTGECVPVQPPYITMSRRPGIGRDWLVKYNKDVYPRDEVIIRGKAARPPKYYDDVLKQNNPELHQIIKEQRREKAKELNKENTPDKLQVKEEIFAIRNRHNKKRNITD